MLTPARDDVASTVEILPRLKRGDAHAFNLLFELHSVPLMRFVARMVNSHHVAADVVQDVFLRLWSGRAHLEIRGDLGGYLRRAARNRALDWLRREDLRREWERTAAYQIPTVSVDAPGAEQDRLAQLDMVLAQRLAAMPERRRTVCKLRWRDGLGPSAIADRLGVSLKTVETHITRGLKDVRSKSSASAL